MTPAEAKKAQHILTAKRRLQAGVEQRSNEETERAVARDAAKEALTTWYRTGFYKANARLPQIQNEDNLRDLRYVHGWKGKKQSKDAYIMLRGHLSGSLTPVVLHLDFSVVPGGTLTFRQLHQQMRCHLQLSAKLSLRLCPDRPWYNYIESDIPVPENHALPAHDTKCHHLFGTTLRYHYYGRPFDYPDVGASKAIHISASDCAHDRIHD